MEGHHQGWCGGATMAEIREWCCNVGDRGRRELCCAPMEMSGDGG